MTVLRVCIFLVVAFACALSGLELLLPVWLCFWFVSVFASSCLLCLELWLPVWLCFGFVSVLCFGLCLRVWSCGYFSVLCFGFVSGFVSGYVDVKEITVVWSGVVATCLALFRVCVVLCFGLC